MGLITKLFGTASQREVKKIMPSVNRILELEETYRVPIHLYYYEGYSIREIAAVLRVRPGTVGSRLSRGREMLKKRLGGDR